MTPLDPDPPWSPLDDLTPAQLDAWGWVICRRQPLRSVDELAQARVLAAQTARDDRANCRAEYLTARGQTGAERAATVAAVAAETRPTRDQSPDPATSPIASNAPNTPPGPKATTRWVDGEPRRRSDRHRPAA